MAYFSSYLVCIIHQSGHRLQTLIYFENNDPKLSYQRIKTNDVIDKIVISNLTSQKM